jgi:hypothetical protein
MPTLSTTVIRRMLLALMLSSLGRGARLAHALKSPSSSSLSIPMSKANALCGPIVKAVGPWTWSLAAMASPSVVKPDTYPGLPHSLFFHLSLDIADITILPPRHRPNQVDSPTDKPSTRFPTNTQPTTKSPRQIVHQPARHFSFHLGQFSLNSKL